jgi:signal transduction histidine kinase
MAPVMVHHGAMTTSAPAPLGVPREVAVAAAATTVGILPVFFGFSEDTLPTGALFCAGWPALGLAAAVLLDREPGHRIGRTMVLLAVIPAALALTAVLTTDGAGVWDRLAVVGARSAVLLVLVTLVALGWAVGLPADRMSRRRLSWFLLWSCVLVACVTAVSMLISVRALALVTTLGIWAFAALVLRLATTSEFRPVDEPLVDATVVLVALLVGAAVAFVIGVGGQRADVPFPEMSAAFAAIVAAALTWPTALWLRRAFLERRYGSGALTPADMAALTADLNPSEDPRELLGRAAEMIRAATGHAGVRLVIGAEPVDPPEGWIAHPLDVGRDQVGTLVIQPSNPEGPEPHQERVVRRMLPTVALMTRAVDLAVTAELARRDVSRQREQERSRILGDLHDGVGPELAGLSMAVQAELRRNPTPLMASLASGLASARGDLRRIVSGLTPSALQDTDLGVALARLIESFDAADGQVELITDLGPGIAPDVAVAVYRSVAEGVANALRHGRADHVTVQVATSQDGTIHVDVHDDGAGGAIVPGVGLTSLQRRAEELGGRLSIIPQQPTGVHLHLELPRQAVA